MTQEKPSRRWYQFSLRTMFVLTLVVSIPLAWVGYSLEWIRQRHVARELYTFSDWENLVAPNGTPSAPSGLWLFGEKSVQAIDSSSDEMEVMRKLFPEAQVYEMAPGATGK